MKYKAPDYPPTYDEAEANFRGSPPPSYHASDPGRVVVSRRLISVLCVIIMILISLLVTLAVKHLQLYIVINGDNSGHSGANETYFYTRSSFFNRSLVLGKHFYR